MIKLYIEICIYIYKFDIINMRLIVKNKSSFGFTKYLYDALYLNDPNYEGYNIASSPIHSQPAKIQGRIYNSV